MAYVDLREGRDEEARQGLELVFEGGPENIDALVGLGILAWRRGDLEAVGTYFGRVEELDPENATAAAYLLRLGEAVEAEAARAQAVLADEAWVQGDTETAAGIYRSILEADHADGRALHRLALHSAWNDDFAESLTLFDRLLELEPDNYEAKVDRARVLGWSGESGEAVRVLDGVLLEHPEYVPALEARARIQSWTGDYSEALASYDQLLGISEDPTGVLMAQARILVRASRLEDSRVAYKNILVTEPRNLEALLGMAQLFALEGWTEAAELWYESILREYPENLDAQRGLARALTWGGRLPAGESAWMNLLETSPGDRVARAGLAQNLRWQGRSAAALEVLQAEEGAQAPGSDLTEQLDWVRASIEPRTRVGLIQEGDSDDNSMTTVQMTGEWNPIPRLALRGDVYTRGLDQSSIDLSRRSWGLNLLGTYQMEPGWLFHGGVGGTSTDGAGKSDFTSLRLGATSPGRYPWGGSVNISKYPLDATAQLVEQGVEVKLAELSGRWFPAPQWQVTGEAGVGSYKGEEGNRRIHVNVRADRRVGGGWTVGLSHRYFGFEKDLDEAYFDPDYFGLTEVGGRFLWEPSPWGLLLEGAPGIQKVRSDGDLSGALRASGRGFYRFGPGKEVSLSLGYSSAGLQSFNTGDSDYRYWALALGGRWVI